MKIQIVPFSFSMEPKINFEWSFKPVFILKSIFGIGFESQNPNQTLFQKIILRTFCLFCLLLFTSCNIIQTIWFNSVQLNFLPDSSISSRVNFWIENMECILLSFQIHTASLILQRNKLTTLDQFIQEIEATFSFENEVYYRCRRLAIYIVVYGLIWVNFKYISPYLPFFNLFNTIMCWIRMSR